MTVSISRKDLRTGTISAFANCMSPRLSLGGAWIVCRNRSFDVLRVPVDGGAPELVARSGLAENEAYYSPYSYGYAGRVAFRSPTEIVYEVVRNTAESTRKVAPWHE